MNEPVWVLPDVVLAVHQMLLAEHGGLPGIRDKSLLDSALNRPRQRYVYDSDCSIFDLAACYSYGLAQNHPFLDGNKRIALTVTAIFLEINGFSFEASESDAVIVFQQLASGQMSETELASWLLVSSIINRQQDMF